METKPYGLLAQFDTAQTIFTACEGVRDAGYQKWDALTPFPVHNLDKAMGLKPSVLPWMVLVMGIIGGVSSMAFMIWTSSVELPMNIGGKPTWSVPAFIPIAFEVTILFSALTAVFGMFGLIKLPRHNHPLFMSKKFERATDDAFFILIETNDPKFDKTNTTALLKELGCTHIEELGQEA